MLQTRLRYYNLSDFYPPLVVPVGLALIMEFRASAVVCSAGAHGETGVLARLFTEQHGLILAYVAGGRGRRLRPILIQGNLVAAQIGTISPQALPFAKLELIESRGPWLDEALSAAAISWCCTLTAATLPERHAYPMLYRALVALLSALVQAPSARGWVPGLIAYEALLLRELGYGEGERDRLARKALSEPASNGPASNGPSLLDRFDTLGHGLARFALAERRVNVMGARERLRALLVRIDGEI